MARKIKTEKVKKNKAKKTIIVILLIVIIGLLVVFGYKILSKKAPGNQVVVKVLSSLDDYGYTLTDQDSAYYKKEFEVLKELLKKDQVNEKEYATQVAKMFAIDLYSMDTKMNNYDIGGYEFFYNEKAEMYAQKVMDTIYAHMLDNTYNDRKQDLPLVKEVVILSSEESEYEMNEETIPAYKVTLTISYEKDLGYDKEATIMLCKEDGARWSVVDFQPSIED